MSLPAGLERESGYPGGGEVDGRGYFWDAFEHVPELNYPASIGTFTKMRRDAKVRECLSAMTLPLRRARWSVHPNGARPEVVQLVATDLGLPVHGEESDQPLSRARGRFSWEEHLRLALLMLPYGHMPFEQLYRILPTGPGGAPQARLRKLAPRLPATIARIKVAGDGGLDGIVQHPRLGTSTTAPPTIGVDRLVWYAHEREGAAWQGQSVLRSAYAPWLLKTEALRVWATSLRRNGIGQPVYHGAQGETDLSKGQDLARRARVSEVSGAAVPFSAGLTFEGVRGTLPDHKEFVRYCDEAIASSMLEEFLKLGSSETGSRALGEAFVDFFLLSLHALAEQLTDVQTSHIVEDLVDLNYGDDEQAPRVVVEDVGTDHRVTAEAISQLLAAGALTADDGLEDYIRRTLYRLPARTTPRASLQVAAGAARARAPRQVRAGVGHREPSPDEEDAQVDFDALHDMWQTRLDDLLTAWAAQRTDQLDGLLDTVRDLLDADDIAGLGALAATTGPGAEVLAEVMTDLGQAAAAEAVAEAGRQGVDLPDMQVVPGAFSDRASAVDELLGRSLADVVARQALLRYTAAAGVDQVVAEVREHVEGLSDTYLRDQLGGALTAAQNAARFEVMATGPVQKVVASELLDGMTCEPCSQVDGRTYPTIAAGSLDYPTGGHKDCLGGPRCRGTLIAIYTAEQPATV